MKNRIIILNIICFLVCCHLVFADEVILNNGEVIEGNITSVDKEGNIGINVVLDNKLTGILIEIEKSEVMDYKVDNKYQKLKRDEPGELDKLTSLILLKNQKELTTDIDKKIRERVEREKNFIKDIEVRQEDRRRYEKGLIHEKEMLVLDTEMQIKLMEASINMGVDPNVNIGINNDKKCFHNQDTGKCY